MTTLSLLAIDAYKTAEAAREEEQFQNEAKRLGENMGSAKARLKKALGEVPLLQWDTENPPGTDGPFIFKVSDLTLEVRSTRYTACEVFLRMGKCPGCQEHLSHHLSLVYYDELEEAKKRNLDEIGRAILAGPDHHLCPAKEEPPVAKARVKNYAEQLGDVILENLSEALNHLGVKWED